MRCAEYWAAQGGMQQAHALLERMRLTNVPSEPYIEAATVDAVYKVTSWSHMTGLLRQRVCCTHEHLTKKDTITANCFTVCMNILYVMAILKISILSYCCVSGGICVQSYSVRQVCLHWIQ
ncbi:hypothetical protein ABBQ38_010384 [Trebouxia sp. C0009 RCD-2024]